MAEAVPLVADPLFLACTRPAMKLGAPMEAAYANLFCTIIGGMVLGSPVWWLLVPVFHVPMVVLANRNPNFFHELRMWFETYGQVIGSVLPALPPAFSGRTPTGV